MPEKPLPVETLVSSKSRDGVQTMFNEIAPKYDFLNHALSFGNDYYWRFRTRYLASQLMKKINKPEILDVATGTGDLAIALRKVKGARVTGVDFSEEMLAIARKKNHDIAFISGDALNLQFPSERFDLVTAGFGVRNFEDLSRGLKEFHRVLKPGGYTLIIEPMIPTSPLIRQAYLAYFKKVLPKVASLFGGSSFAYDYLPKSVEKFPQGEAFLKELGKAGFRSGKVITMTLETAVLYLGEK
ncbi:MAG: bifunctional demethylmenaquinone methyltransferase/2-methoxy-6-polyprenyl-1,4-benzoquinol methylase UbiE [Chloroherpetonaceae bacterium]|nr:bifunctional demethylmenaquinone methyltransferase/2-methoxy-6-polyprenyl-1,4-benzoquinol methylase UbiE [Chloroherpetonaceae bacterium]